MKTKFHPLVAGMLLATVGAGIAQPVINIQPQNQTNFVGTTATFTVGAAGTESLAYQWQRDSSGVFSDLLDATNASLILPDVQTSDAADYRVVVTDTTGTTNSDAAHLYILVPPTLQFAGVSYTVPETAGSVTLYVQRSGTLDAAVTVDYATADGTATNGAKYTPVSSTLAFAVGENIQSIVVPILNTAFAEGTQSFYVRLKNAGGGAVLGPLSSAIVNITDNDPGIQVELANYWVREDAGSVVIAVTRGPEEIYPATVDYATADSAAVAGLDYSATTGTLSFAADEKRKLVTIAILNDTIREANETFRLTLSNPTGDGLGTARSATVTIEDNDPGIQVEFANYWAREDSGQVVIAVTRGSDENWPVTVNFATGNMTAQAGVDYTATNGTLSFAADEHLKLFGVSILNDGVRKAAKTFRLTLSNPTGGSILGLQQMANVTILDNDPGVQFAQNQLVVHQQAGTVVLTVTRGNDLLLDAFTVDYATTNGTATAAIDYTKTNGTLTFAAGEMCQSFAVPILDDGVAKKDRQFQVALSNPTGGMLLGTASNATATVLVWDAREMLPHQFEHVQVRPNGTASLTLDGGFTPGLGVVNRWQDLFDIYPLEVSTNLVDWAPLTWVVRTNAVTNQLMFVDSEAGSFTRRFYRTPGTTFVVPQRVPSGPYPVGVTARTVHDDTRRNRYRISTNCAFPITIWYPARRVSGGWPGAWDPRGVFSWADGSPRLYCHSLSNAPFAEALAGLPVVFWSHGYPDFRYDGQELAEHLASHGYVVVGVDHFDSSYVVYPDGTYIYTDTTDQTGRELNAQQLQNRVRDLAAVLEELGRWNQADDIFAGRLDLQHVAAVGWSFGGVTAGEFCRTDERCLAAVALDPGGYQSPLTLLGLQKPSLTMHRQSYTDYTLFSKATTNAYWFQIQYTEHQSFSTWYWLVTSTTLDRSREVARTITDYTLWFMNKYLKGATDPTPVLADYPQVLNFKQK